MPSLPTAIALAIALSLPLSLPAQNARRGQRAPADTGRSARDSGAARRDSAKNSSDSLRISAIAQRPPVVTHHTIQLAGKPLSYTATVGMLPVRNDASGGTMGYIFYVAYTKDGMTDPGKRPITFVFNGGPGSSTVWLHMGAFGPRRVKLLPDGAAPAPPYALEDNPYTLLDQTDLVFLDPVGTGYSRPANPKLGTKFWGLDQDISTVGEFIRLYLTHAERWASPKFLAGESYGTTRAAGLSGWLADNGIALNGVVLISTILNFGNSSQSRSNDIGFVNFLPSYTAIAWYHKKLPADLQSQSVEDVTKLAETWARTDYAAALSRGSALAGNERTQAIAQMARFTGLSTRFIDNNDLRVTLGRFDAELLRDERETVGRLDGRFTSYAIDNGGERGAFDPSEAGIRNSFTPVFNDYIRRELKYDNDAVYWILGGGIEGRWQFPQGRYADVTPALERAFAKNPYMKLFVAMGYYDTATPYFAVEYMLDHLSIAPAARKNIDIGHFHAGHMVYIDDASMKAFRGELTEFIGSADGGN